MLYESARKYNPSAFSFRVVKKTKNVTMFSMNAFAIGIIPDEELGGFTARIPDVPAYGEGVSEELAIADLKEALQAYVAEFGIDDALARMSVPTKLHRIETSLEEFSLSA